MTKKEIIACIDWAKYVALICATICVLIFQFVSSSICITLALAFYVVGFSLMCASMIIHTVELFKASDIVKEEHANATLNKSEEARLEEGGLEGQKVEVVHTKNEKVWGIIGSVFFGLFAIFTFVVLVLY